MLTQSLQSLYARELDKVIKEVELYQNEHCLWITTADISNSAGNLTLHLVGNLNHFIGHLLGSSGYIRERPLEFSSKNIPKQQLIEKLQQTKIVVIETLANLKEDSLQQVNHNVMLEKDMTTEMLLLHLLSHLSYHLGQINYHRRLLDS